MKGKVLKYFACFLFLTVFIPASYAAIQYQVIDLVDGMSPVAISDNGKVLLSERIGYMDHKLYIWDNGQTTLLDHFPQGNISVGIGINNNGEVIANIYEESPFSVYSCHWKDGQRTTYPDVYLWNMNNNGQLLADDGVGSYILWPDGTKQYLNGYSANMLAGISLNDNGTVTGGTDHFSTDFHGFLWSESEGIKELKPLTGEYYSAGIDLNNHGQVLGYSADALDYDDYDLELNLVLWDPTEGLIDLGCRYGYWHGVPYDINDQGQIVGMLKRPGDSDFEPYLWQKETGFINMGDLVQGIDSVIRINNQGEIIGSMGGHGVLLTPVPEPGSLVLILLGAGLLGKRIGS